MRITLDSFVSVIERSELLDGPTLKTALAEFGAQPPGSAHAKALAEFLCRKEMLTVWQAEKLLQGKHRGFSLGRYRLLSLLGKGGMSSVYLAEHMVMKRRCAVKVLPTRKSKNAAYLSRFHREARAVAMLDHPNIVRAYDVDQALDGSMEIHFLVMEYVSGKTLFETVKTSGPLPLAKAVDSIRQAALGLDHAHKAGLIHRDVKPENLIVDRQGVLKVMDLGLARFFEKDEEQQLTVHQDDRVLGTANYCSPEQAVDSHFVDARTDIYSLGCTFYYLLTGQPPFNTGTLAQRLMAHQSKDPPPIESKRPDVPTELNQILLRMMAKVPANRYQTVAEVAQALDAFTHSKAGIAAATRPIVPAVPQAEPEEVDLFKEFEEAFRGASESETDPNDASLTPGGSEPSAIELFFEQMSDPNSSSDSAVHPGGSSPAAAPAPSKAAGQGRPAEPIDVAGADAKSPRKSPATIKTLPKPASETSQGGIWTRETLWKNALWIGLGAAAAAAIIAWGVMSLFGPQGIQRPVVTATDTEIRVGPTGHFATVTDAIDAIINQQLAARTVRIAGGYSSAEKIVLNGKGARKCPPGLKLRGDGAPRPVLRPAEGGGVIAQISDLDDLAIEGLEFDAAGGDTAIHISGFLVGTRLSGLVIRGFGRSGIEAQNVGGFPDNPFRMESVTLRSGNPKAVGIRWNATAREKTAEVELKKVTLVGPFEAAMEFAGTVREFRIESSIIHRANVGVRFAQANQVIGDMALVNNTFSGCRRGIVFAGQPGPNSTPLKLFHNLFVSQEGPEATIETGMTPEIARSAASAQFVGRNWSDRPVPDNPSEEGFDVFARDGRRGISAPAFVSLDPVSPDFLKPQPGQLGVEKNPNGNGAAYVGAVSP